MTFDFATVEYGENKLDRDTCLWADSAVAQALIAALRDLGGRRVLVVGARMADCVEAVVQAGFEITLLDSNEERLARIRQACLADSVCGRSTGLALRTGSYDSALALGVPVDADCADAFFREIRRVVRGGVAIEAVTRENLQTLWYRHYFSEIDGGITGHPALGTVMTAALRAGFGHARAKPVFHSRGYDFSFRRALVRPDLLFDERFRGALPEFAALDPGGVGDGLRKLRLDLDSGQFELTRARFESNHAVFGDSFVVTLHTS